MSGTSGARTQTRLNHKLFGGLDCELAHLDALLKGINVKVNFVSYLV